MLPWKLVQRSSVRAITEHWLQGFGTLNCKWCYFSFFLAFDFCRFCVVIRFFSSPPQRPMTSDFEGFSIPDCIHYIYFPIFRKSQYFPFWMFSAKQGHYCYHFYNVFGMTRSLTGDWTRDLSHSKHYTTRLSKRRCYFSVYVRYVCAFLTQYGFECILKYIALLACIKVLRFGWRFTLV